MAPVFQSTGVAERIITRLDLDLSHFTARPGAKEQRIDAHSLIGIVPIIVLFLGREYCEYQLVDIEAPSIAVASWPASVLASASPYLSHLYLSLVI
jgi:hypothetical protein